MYGSDPDGPGTPGEPPPADLGERLGRVAAQTSAAVDLMGLLVHLAHGPLPVSALTEGGTALPERLAAALGGEPGAGTLTKLLAEEGLCALRGGDLTVDAPVGNGVRAAMSEASQKGWTRSAVRFVLAVFPIQLTYEGRIALCDQMLPHALAAAGHAERFTVAADSRGKLLNHLGLYLNALDRSGEAEACLRRSIAAGERTSDIDPAVLAIRWNNLGAALQSAERLDDAAPCFKRAVDMLRAHAGVTDKRLAAPLRNLYGIQMARQDWAAARESCTAAAAVHAEHFDFDDPVVAECENALGIVSNRLGEPDTARKYFERAILAASSAERTNAAQLATYRTNFGHLLLEAKEFDEAEHEFKLALELDREQYRGNHLAVARDLANIGETYHAREKYGDAQAHYEEALQVSGQAAGELSPDRLPYLRHLQRLFDTTQNQRGLAICLAKTIAIEERRAGKDAPVLIAPLVRLGRALEARDRFDQAQECYERALELQRGVPGASAEDEAMIEHRLARVHMAQGRAAEAVPLLEQALARHRSIHGEQHEKVARDAFHLGCALIECGDAMRGAGHLSLAQRIYEEKFGPNHRRTLEVEEMLSGTRLEG